MSRGGNGRTRILVFYAKLGTKGIDGFVEAILCALQCSKLVTEYFYFILNSFDIRGYQKTGQGGARHGVIKPTRVRLLCTKVCTQ